ncbi:ABC transporter substrate-binding protein [bacterium]|nr:ABC transporter substrate-binding protein [bacterium]
MIKKICFLVLVFLFVACSQPAKPKEESEVPCKRIVSTAPSITETLFDLGLGENVVGVTENCHYPEEVKSKSKIGKAFSISSEAVIALKPDIVFVLSAYGELASKMKAAGMKTVILDQTSVQGFVDSIDVVAEACKIEEKGKNFKAKFEPYLKKAEKEGEKKKILILVGRDYENSSIKDAYAVGDDRFLNEIVNLCGATNAYSGNMAYPKIQLEGILSLNPDIVIDIITASGLTPEKLDFIAKSWSNLDINAVKNGKVFIKTEDFWSLPGPRFTKIIEEIKNILE